jgi:hypothetical protein
MFTKIAVFIFALIGLVHILRIAFGWEAIIGGLMIPMWVSIVAIILAFWMAWGLWKKPA